MPLLVLLTVFGLLVVTATPVNAIPQRLRRSASGSAWCDAADGRGTTTTARTTSATTTQWREARPAPSRTRRAAPRAPRSTTRTGRAGGARPAPRPPAGGPLSRPTPPLDRHDGRRGRGRGRRRRAGRAVLHGVPALAARRRPQQRRRGGPRRPRRTRPSERAPGAAPVPAARSGGRQGRAKPEQDERTAAVPDLTKAPARGAAANCRRAPNSSSSPATSRTRCPRSTCWSGAGPGKTRSAANDAVVESLTNVFTEFKVDAAGHRLHPRPDGHPVRGRARPGREGRADHGADQEHRLRRGQPGRADHQPDPGQVRGRHRDPQQRPRDGQPRATCCGWPTRPGTTTRCSSGSARTSRAAT